MSGEFAIAGNPARIVGAGSALTYLATYAAMYLASVLMLRLAVGLIGALKP